MASFNFHNKNVSLEENRIFEDYKNISYRKEIIFLYKLLYNIYIIQRTIQACKFLFHMLDPIITLDLLHW